MNPAKFLAGVEPDPDAGPGLSGPEKTLPGIARRLCEDMRRRVEVAEFTGVAQG